MLSSCVCMFPIHRCCTGRRVESGGGGGGGGGRHAYCGPPPQSRTRADSPPSLQATFAQMPSSAHHTYGVTEPFCHQAQVSSISPSLPISSHLSPSAHRQIHPATGRQLCEIVCRTSMHDPF
ncbi:hypothetical protein Vretimale_9736 [Volvox reticuliferus]|uniref:Uncharacterized protein n=1 Tax=Volvox reticuliferus TaxID=1737510 RepID=A0A8J4LQB0_9CHLO|nr:hypothetical protein Vretimale_9736 [Volvox reticuliferus]